MERAVLSRPIAARLAGALTLAYFQRCAAAWILAWPVVYGAGASGVLQFPSGDALLFEPGGAFLLEVLHDQARGLIAAYRAYWPLLSLAAGLGVVPQWLLFRACAARSTPPHRAERWGELSRFAGLSLVLWVARAFTVVGAVLASVLVAGLLSAHGDERVPDLAALAMLALGALALGALSLLQDTSSGAIVSEGCGLRSALARAAQSLRARFLLFGAAYAALCVVRAAIVLGCAVLVSASSPAVAAALHQLAVIGVLGSRGVWIWLVMSTFGPGRRSGELTSVARLAGSSNPG